MDPTRGAADVTSPARAVIRMRASARSAGGAGRPSSSSASPQATAAADIRCIATVSTTSTAGTSARSRAALDGAISGISLMAGTLPPD